MVAPSIATSFERRDQQRLLRRRQRAESRLLRERKRNARLALAGCLTIALVLGLGIHSTLAPAAVPVQMTALDPESVEFHQTRVGHVLLTSADSAYCRELRFDNDNGRISEAGRYRCFIDNEPTLNPGAPPHAKPNDPNMRADTIGSFFKKR